eukprot:5695438-Pyramimonas_sp.AAC.1
MHEIYNDPEAALDAEYAGTSSHKGDFFTKVFGPAPHVRPRPRGHAGQCQGSQELKTVVVISRPVCFLALRPARLSATAQGVRQNSTAGAGQNSNGGL